MYNHMRYDPACPNEPTADRLVLSEMPVLLSMPPLLTSASPLGKIQNTGDP
jgi:hypothetical protein